MENNRSEYEDKGEFNSTDESLNILTRTEQLLEACNDETFEENLIVENVESATSGTSEPNIDHDHDEFFLTRRDSFSSISSGSLCVEPSESHTNIHDGDSGPEAQYFNIPERPRTTRERNCRYGRYRFVPSDNSDNEFSDSNFFNNEPSLLRTECCHARIFGDDIAVFNSSAENRDSVSPEDTVFEGEILPYPYNFPNYSNDPAELPILTIEEHLGIGRPLMGFRPSKNPPKLCYGHRSFQPTAKLEKCQGYPAKPGVEGFSYCHEKAMAARYVINSIQHDNLHDEQDLTSSTDIFNRFWIETNVIDKEKDDSPITSAPYSRNISYEEALAISSLLMPSQNDSTITAPRSLPVPRTVDLDPNYSLWDNETSTIHNPLNYDLWGDAVQTQTSEHDTTDQVRPSIATTTVGVGTDDLYSGHDENRLTATGSRSWPGIGNSRSQTDSHSFGLTGDFEERIAEMFLMERPNIPSNCQTQISRNQVPRSFLEEAYNRGECASNFTSDSENSESNNLNDDEGASVFHQKIPEVDNTPTGLVSELNCQPEELPENKEYVDFFETQIDDVFFIFEVDSRSRHPPPAIDEVQFQNLIQNVNGLMANANNTSRSHKPESSGYFCERANDCSTAEESKQDNDSVWFNKSSKESEIEAQQNPKKDDM